jgi:hypothetical protein
LKDLAIDHFKSKPLDFTSPCSPFIYDSTGHATNGDFNIINNTSLQYVLSNKSINWKHGRGEIKRLRLEVVNGEILQRVFVVEDIDYARNSEGMRDYRNNVIFYIGRYVRFD